MGNTPRIELFDIRNLLADWLAPLAKKISKILHHRREVEEFQVKWDSMPPNITFKMGIQNESTDFSAGLAIIKYC